jgi:hypothetical protein
VISDFPLLGLKAVDLLLSIAESPRMAISGAALDGFHKKIGTELVNAGAIKPDGFEAVAVSPADHDDAIVILFGVASWAATRVLVRLSASSV